MLSCNKAGFIQNWVVVMRNVISLWAVVCLASVMMGCMSTEVGDVAHKKLKFGKKEDLASKAVEPQEPQKPALPSAQALQIPIGTVHMVDQVGKFILIKSSRTTSLEPDAQIIAYGPNAQMSSHLKASPARKGAYLTADLIEGIPSVGDMVMMVKSMSKPAEGAAPGSTGSNVQVLE